MTVICRHMTSDLCWDDLCFSSVFLFLCSLIFKLLVSLLKLQFVCAILGSIPFSSFNGVSR
jgi:hypothetical protein